MWINIARNKNVRDQRPVNRVKDKLTPWLAGVEAGQLEDQAGF
jgi:hypothetical protein